jgi:hypothetical protein
MVLGAVLALPTLGVDRLFDHFPRAADPAHLEDPRSPEGSRDGLLRVPDGARCLLA